MLTVAWLTSAALQKVAHREVEFVDGLQDQKAFVDRIVDTVDGVALRGDNLFALPMASSLYALQEEHKIAKAQHLSPAMLAIYFGGTTPLDGSIRQFSADAQAIMADPLNTPEALSRLKDIGNETIPETIDKAVNRYKAESYALMDLLSKLEYGAYVIVAILSILQVLAAFLPLQRSAWNILARADSLKRRLRETSETLARRTRELRELRKDVEHSAMHDALTKLPNRRSLEKELLLRCNGAESKTCHSAILHLDIDRFRQINDTLGHAAGDLVLSHVAGVLRRTLPERDFIARTGGDEFVILTRTVQDREKLEELASKIIEELSNPLIYNGQICQCSVSIGIDSATTCSSCSGSGPERILTNADIAQNHAREVGCGRYAFFNEAMRAEFERDKTLSDEIISAFSSSEFFVVYQPQVNAISGELVGVEALARWRHPSRGIIGPGTFLPIANRLGLTPQIDEFVLRQALADLKYWDESGVDVPHLSVNVSAQRLRDCEFQSSVRKLDIPRGRLCFEILENVFIDSLDDMMREMLKFLAEVGINIELDDFGTGHASIAGLVALSPQRLKIARELIKPLPHSEAHHHLLSSIIQIARALGIDIIAEGVETEEQSFALLAAGCPTMQGFLFDRPLTADELSARLAANNGWQPSRMVA
ncbi:putative bifunctional diguanylate cyclase/phosphodiesterase [Oricola sp.]|uniref:putative bifunctional diguanylate cyclase/phosphodiesterase n=1 Tax=Oricola sp. TaxID=1979950 RepID=UPI003BA8E3DB